MRIALVCARYAPFAGGVESHVEEIAKRLARHGESVDVLTQRYDPELPETEERDGVLVRRHKVPVASKNFGVSPAVWLGLRQRRQEYDIIHVHGYHTAAPLTGALARVSPMIFTPHYHGTGHSLFRKALHVPYRRVGAGIVGRSDRVICVSQAEADLFLAHFPSAAGRVRIIPNGADLERIREARPFGSGEAVVITGGRLESYKHIDRIVDAMAFTTKMRLIVTGEGPERERLESLASRRGLGGRVAFTGRVDTETVYRWYATARVFCSMSTNEAMPVTILELLAAGASVVASDIPAHQDILGRTAGAISIVPKDVSPAELAKALQLASCQPPVENQRIPTWDEVTMETLGVYHEVARDVVSA
jgi:glycosyltransferase involved in cell wall biosynthesis